MEVEHHAWLSRHTGETMRLVRYGTRGAPLVYVPSSGGDETEFERYGMLGVCRPALDAGRVQVVAIDGHGPRTFWNDALTPAERIRGYARLERYVAEECLPWVAARAGTPRVGLVGASYGAFIVANLLLKEPDRVDVGCGLGGVYGLWHRLDGHYDDTVYFHTPLDYLPGLDDPGILERIRATRGLVVFAAARDEWLDSSRRLVRLLRAKQIPHQARVWPAPADHHERWWRSQLARFVDRCYPAVR